MHPTWFKYSHPYQEKTKTLRVLSAVVYPVVYLTGRFNHKPLPPVTLKTQRTPSFCMPLITARCTQNPKRFLFLIESLPYQEKTKKPLAPFAP